MIVKSKGERENGGGGGGGVEYCVAPK
jgi:hypothetical protein